MKIQASCANDDADKFLELIKPPWTLTAIIPDGETLTRTFSKKEDKEAALRFIVRHNAAGENVYYSVNRPKREMKSKTTKKDIGAVEYLHVDADPNDGESPEEFKARLQPLLANYDKKPTLVVDSGNGIHLLWRLDEPAKLNGEGSFDEIEDRNSALARDFGAAPTTRNVDRILRVPGTVNYPNDTKRKAGRGVCQSSLLEYNDVSYSLTAFKVEAKYKDTSAKDIWSRRYDGFRKITPALRSMLHLNDAGEYESRSELLFAFLCRAISKNAADEEIIADCLNHKFAGCAIYEHCEENGGKPYVERQIKRAEAKVKDDAADGQKQESPKRLKTPADFFAEYVPANYVIEPVIDSGGLYTLTAKTGSGKTAFLILATTAVALGRRDLLRNDIEPGRVAYLTCENPRNLRMRLMATFGELGIDEAEASNLLIQDWFGKPDEMLASLKLHEAEGPFKLIVIDTLQSFFPGDNFNDNAQARTFLRDLRPLTGLAGSPAVVVAAHPVKNATDENLVPYGGGAILNEVDGNLTLVKQDSDRVILHWHQKIRGIEFDPISFELREITSDLVKNAKGESTKMPFLASCDSTKAADDWRTDGERKIQVLEEIAQTPNWTQKELCEKLDIHKGTMSKWVKGFVSRKWIEVSARGGLRITDKGKKELALDGEGQFLPGCNMPGPKA